MSADKDLQPSSTRDDDSDSPAPAGTEDLNCVSLDIPRRQPWSRKGLLAVALLAGSVISVSVAGIHRLTAGVRKPPDESGRQMHDRPAAAAAEPRRLEMPAPASSAASATTVRVPALTASEQELVEAIAVRRTGPVGPSSRSVATALPEDAPVLLVSARSTTGANAPSSDRAGEQGEPPATARDPLAATSRNLQAYQHQLQGMLDNLTRTAGIGTSASAEAAPATGASLSTVAPSAPQGLFGGQLQGSATPRALASALRQRSLTLPKGTAFTCALKTRVISAASGLLGCLVQRDVYGDDGRVLLIERGSHLDGEYRITSVRPGTVRIPVLWTRVRTPLGVTVDIESPGTGPLGEAGIDGQVDNRWSERIGAAMLLSLIDDAVKISLQNQGNDRQGDTVILPSTTNNTSKLAEKVLDSTINIPPLIYQHQGAVVGIYVARDVDFSPVYQLVPTEERRP